MRWRVLAGFRACWPDLENAVAGFDLSPILEKRPLRLDCGPEFGDLLARAANIPDPNGVVWSDANPLAEAHVGDEAKSAVRYSELAVLDFQEKHHL
jgi:hypothetical protein